MHVCEHKKKLNFCTHESLFSISCSSHLQYMTTSMKQGGMRSEKGVVNIYMDRCGLMFIFCSSQRLNLIYRPNRFYSYLFIFFSLIMERWK